jgi:hypothetical protein
VNLALGVGVIVSDFVATATPDTVIDAATRLTSQTSMTKMTRKSKTKMTRKTVVAPFVIDETTNPVESCTNEATVLEPVQCKPGIEYLKLVTLGCGITMDNFLEALAEDARVRHQVDYSDDDLERLLSISSEKTTEGVAAALLSDLQERLSAGEYGEHKLLQIAVCQKGKQQAAVVLRGPSLAIAADVVPLHRPRAEVEHAITSSSSNRKSLVNKFSMPSVNSSVVFLKQTGVKRISKARKMPNMMDSIRSHREEAGPGRWEFDSDEAYCKAKLEFECASSPNTSSSTADVRQSDLD